MLKWIVIAVLVMGTFGIVWSAPWKDDVERLTADARARVEQALTTVDRFGLDENCARVAQPAPAVVKKAVAAIRANARQSEDVRAAARAQADAVAACFTQVKSVGAGWRRVEKDLRAASRA